MLLWKHLWKTRLGICIYKTLLLHRPYDYIGFTSRCPPTFCNKIAPMHPSICSWDYAITEIAGENTKGCSWYTTLKILQAGMTRLATHKSLAIASWHRPHFVFAPHFSAFTFNKLQSLPLWNISWYSSWYPEFVHIRVFVGNHETIKNNQEDLKH